MASCMSAGQPRGEHKKEISAIGPLWRIVARLATHCILKAEQSYPCESPTHAGCLALRDFYWEEFLTVPFCTPYPSALLHKIFQNELQVDNLVEIFRYIMQCIRIPHGKQPVSSKWKQSLSVLYQVQVVVLGAERLPAPVFHRRTFRFFQALPR